MSEIAALPWYEFAETRALHDALWRELRTHLLEAGFARAPLHLVRRHHHDAILRRTDLLLTQTCGYVAVGPGRPHVQVVATPCYSAPGCAGADYASHVVVTAAVRADDVGGLRGLRCAVNERWSHSGLNVLRALVAPLHVAGRFFATVTTTGGHLHSLLLLAGGRADVAAIDCVTWELVRRHRPTLLRGLRILCTTARYAAPPFVTSAQLAATDLQRLRRALHDFGRCPRARAACEPLLLDGVAVRPLEDYEPMLAAESAALQLGYVEMASPAARMPPDSAATARTAD